MKITENCKGESREWTVRRTSTIPFDKIALTCYYESMSAHRLSKSKFMSGLQCPKRIWLEIHRPELVPPTPPSQQRQFDQGSRVGELARERFPGGVLIDADYPNFSEGFVQSREALERGAEVIFEGVFSHDSVLVRPDVLRRAQAGRWDLIEVKSTTGVKEEHIDDVAIQAHVLNGTGMRVERACLMHLNRECVYPDLSNLFTIEEITDFVGEVLPGIPDKLGEIRAILDRDSEPEIRIGQHCHKPYNCPFVDLCWSWLPEHSIFTIPGLKWTLKRELLDAGRVRIDALEPGLPFTPGQQQYIRSYLGREAIIDRDAIAGERACLEPPIHFLDFETDNPAVPRFDGMRPYDKYPFQFSCHVVDRDGGVTHREYLHEDESDPRHPLTEALIDAVGNKGTVVAYNAPFEKGVLNALGEWLPEYAEPLGSIADRLWDQLLVFRNHYTDYRFGGSNGLKNVLPVVVPSMSYDDLAVRDGDEAGFVWNEMIRMEAGEEKDRRIRDLKAYCGQDTWAMVEIHRALERL